MNEETKKQATSGEETALSSESLEAVAAGGLQSTPAQVAVPVDQFVPAVQNIATVRK